MKLALAQTVQRPDEAAWQLQDIPYERIEVERVREDVALFYLLATASMVESGAALYTRNLIQHFDGDADVSGWLRQQWEVDELRHGCALRRYVECVWPEFEWQRTYDGFLDEYGRGCSQQALEPSRSLEMAARCVVETGTATLYRALGSMTGEPVLQQLARRLHADEVRHYKHFYRHFRRLNAAEHWGRLALMRCELRRLLAMRTKDGEIAVRHVHAMRLATGHRDASAARITRTVSARLRTNLPAEMTVKMLLRPLALAPGIEPWVRRSLVGFMQRVVLR